MKILFLVPYPLNEAPSQRFRFEQYVEALQNKGHKIKVQSFLNAADWKIFYSPGKPVRKLAVLIAGLLKRVSAVFSSAGHDMVFIHRELAPVGPPFFEWIMARVLRKRILYDFDDAIWLTDRTSESTLARLLRWRGKVASICTWSYKISCGNDWLAEYARKHNSHVVVNPTTIDSDKLHNPDLYPAKSISERITIGWTGSHSTLKYLNGIADVLKELEKKYDEVDFLVIADRKPDLTLDRLNFISWWKESEADDLLKMDIGIMPLPDDEWAKGKCGFKALQYMAMRIPCVVSPVGVNPAIVAHGETGFLASTHEEWFEYLEKLVNDPELRKAMGQKGREKVIAGYSVASNTANFLALFE